MNRQKWKGKRIEKIHLVKSENSHKNDPHTRIPRRARARRRRREHRVVKQLGELQCVRREQRRRPQQVRLWRPSKDDRRARQCDRMIMIVHEGVKTIRVVKKHQFLNISHGKRKQSSNVAATRMEFLVDEFVGIIKYFVSKYFSKKQLLVIGLTTITSDPTAAHTCDSRRSANTNTKARSAANAPARAVSSSTHSVAVIETGGDTDAEEAAPAEGEEAEAEAEEGSGRRTSHSFQRAKSVLRRPPIHGVPSASSAAQI
jgi:hypothetical protein